MIGREKMRFRPGTLKSSRDTVVVSVYWGRENSYRIAFIRRSDAATAFVDIPQELRGEFARFDRDMVLLRAGELGIAVAWALSNIEFRNDWEFAKLALRGMEPRPHLNLVASVDSGRWGLALTLGSLKSRIECCLCEKGLMPAKPSRAGSTA